MSQCPGKTKSSYLFVTHCYARLLSLIAPTSLQKNLFLQTPMPGNDSFDVEQSVPPIQYVCRVKC